MTGKPSGAVKRTLEKAPNAMSAEDMVPALHQTLKDVLKVVKALSKAVKRHGQRAFTGAASCRGLLAFEGEGAENNWPLVDLLMTGCLCCGCDLSVQRREHNV